MKKLLFAPLIVIVSFAIAITVIAYDGMLPALSELSDEDCMLFLEENGIDMPPVFKTESAWLAFARSVIEQVEADPDVVIGYNAYVMYRCASEIKNAVNAYYGQMRPTTYAFVTVDELLYNTPHGTWSNSYYNYGAYTYAIDYYVPYETDFGEAYWYDPGQIWWNLNGNSTAEFYFNGAANAETIADLIVQDLHKLGYTVDSPSLTMPNTFVDEHTKLICVRKDMDGIPTGEIVGGEQVYWYDYHVMKLGDDGWWYHKMQASNPLRYNNVPVNSSVWVAETAIGNPFVFSRREEWTYDSDIWFIEYTTPHVWEYAFWESGQHVMSCTICGEEQLEDCEWSSPAYVGLNSHQFTCLLCGGLGGNTACTLDYINYYFPELNPVHQTVCTVCSHAYTDPENCALVYTACEDGTHTSVCTVCDYTYTTPESCTLVYTDNEDGTHTATCTVCGGVYNGDCAYQYTYSGDSSSTHTHTKECTDCDHSEEESCTFKYISNKNATHKCVCKTCGYVKATSEKCLLGTNNICLACGYKSDIEAVNKSEGDYIEN